MGRQGQRRDTDAPGALAKRIFRSLAALPDADASTDELNAVRIRLGASKIAELPIEEARRRWRSAPAQARKIVRIAAVVIDLAVDAADVVLDPRSDGADIDAAERFLARLKRLLPGKGTRGGGWASLRLRQRRHQNASSLRPVVTKALREIRALRPRRGMPDLALLRNALPPWCRWDEHALRECVAHLGSRNLRSTVDAVLKVVTGVGDDVRLSRVRQRSRDAADD